MAHDSQDFSSPQEAIEGYLEALLQDVADYDDEHDEELIVPESRDPEPSPEVLRAKSEVATDSNRPKKDAVWDTDDNETRIFAPPSARAYAQEAAARIKEQRQQPTLLRTAVKETAPVVMPELKVATATEVKSDQPKPTSVQKQADPDIATPVVEPSIAVDNAVVEAPATDLNDKVVTAEPAVTVPVEHVALSERQKAVSEQNEQQVSVPVPLENTGWTGGRPDWAQGRFECLLFDVKGLRLAVPLAELGGIHKLEKEPTPLFGQPSWFLGIVRANNMNLGLVDTAQWVMSERIDSDHKPDFRFAIRIHNSEWALACHEVAEAISLHPDEVKWRTRLGRRPWLAGTVVDQMCALIDVAAFARLLDSDKVPVDLQALMSDEE